MVPTWTDIMRPKQRAMKFEERLIFRNGWCGLAVDTFVSLTNTGFWVCRLWNRNWFNWNPSNKQVKEQLLGPKQRAMKFEERLIFRNGWCGLAVDTFVSLTNTGFWVCRLWNRNWFNWNPSNKQVKEQLLRPLL